MTMCAAMYSYVVRVYCALHVCIHVCMHVRVCMGRYVHRQTIHTHTGVVGRIRARRHVCMHACMHVCTMCPYMYVCIYGAVYIHAHAERQALTHTLPTCVCAGLEILKNLGTCISTHTLCSMHVYI